MKNELQNTELTIQRQKELPVIYNKIKLDCGYRLDLIAN